MIIDWELYAVKCLLVYSIDKRLILEDTKEELSAYPPGDFNNKLPKAYTPIQMRTNGK